MLKAWGAAAVIREVEEAYTLKAESGLARHDTYHHGLQTHANESTAVHKIHLTYTYGCTTMHVRGAPPRDPWPQQAAPDRRHGGEFNHISALVYDHALQFRECCSQALRPEIAVLEEDTAAHIQRGDGLR